MLLPEMAAYPALRIQRTGPVRWRGRRSDSGRRSGLAHQPARAVACLGAVSAFLPIFSSICIPLLECEPNGSEWLCMIIWGVLPGLAAAASRFEYQGQLWPQKT